MLYLEVSGKRKRGRPKKTWKKQTEKDTETIGSKTEKALNQGMRKKLQREWGECGQLR